MHHWKPIGSAAIGLALLVVPWAWPDMPPALHWAVWPAVAAGLIYAASGWSAERRAAGRMGLEAPQIVMIVGIALVLAGLAWQIYRDLHSGSVASGSAVAESQPVVRRLSLPQKDLVAEQLKKHGWEPDTVWIRFESGCSECKRYASDFADAFTRAGWSDRISTTLDERHDLAGLLLSVADLNAQTQTARLLASTLREAGIDFQMVPWPELSSERTILWVHQPKI